MNIITATLLATAAFSAIAKADERPSPFNEPTVKYLGEYRQSHKKTFVLERYDASGKIANRETDEIIAPVTISDATHRTINGKELVLRGLNSCPSQKVIYNAQQTWNCKDAAKDYAGTIYNDRASVILCKTLVLNSTPGHAEPVSCYALVGSGTSSDPFAVANDDDAMVFQGLASIALSKDGKPLRPDLLKSAVMGKEMGLGNASN